ncbi:MAG TPA: hypothetical protein DCR48_02585 [Flavobacteriales bacterium]|nr:hypothetical protein [Flavobacteriales bacterium]
MSKAEEVFVVRMVKEEPDGITIIKKGDMEFFLSHSEAHQYMHSLFAQNIFWKHELRVQKMYKLSRTISTHPSDENGNSNSKNSDQQSNDST